MSKLFLMLAVLLGTTSLALAEDSYEDQMISLINSERTKVQLPALEKDSRLMKIAAEWAQTMAAKKKMFHRDTLRPFLKEYGWKVMNENISASPSRVTAENVVSRWMKSPGHRRNLLQDNIQLIGVGIATSDTGEFYAVFNGSAPWPPSNPSN